MKTPKLAVAVFAETIGALGGEVTSRGVTGFTHRKMFCRAILPIEEEVQPKDKLKPGVALRATSQTLEVVPYVFRIVCGNGALWTHNGTACSLQTDHTTTAAAVEDFVRLSTKIAARPETFQACLKEVRAATHAKVEAARAIFAMVDAQPSDLDDDIIRLALDELPRHPAATTRYDAMNVVTAAAREVHDPELQWKMEALATTLLTGAEAGEEKRPAVRAREFATV